MVDKRKDKRHILNKNIKVKEDNGELIRYYEIKDISSNGMFLNKKIKDFNEHNAKYTIMFSNNKLIKIKGQILDTRKEASSYGTAVKFLEAIDLDTIINS